MSPDTKKSKGFKDLSKKRRRDSSPPPCQSSDSILFDNTTQDSSDQNPSGSHSLNNIFVRNLPYNATNQDLEKFFEEIGPIRNCFVVKETKDGPTDDEPILNRGFGFVQYSLIEDAAKAIKELAKVQFMGRLLKLEYATRLTKNPDGRRSSSNNNTKTSGSNTETRKHPKHRAKTSDIKSDRTLVITDIPLDATHAELMELLEKCDIKPMELNAKKGLALAAYETVELAKLASARIQRRKIHDQPLGGMLLTNLLIKTKHTRVVLRNLSFKLGEKDIEHMFDAYGPTIEVTLPRKSDGTNALLGYGFVQFTNITSAEKAVEGLNGTKHHGRPIVVDMCASKAKFQATVEKELEEENSESDNNSKIAESESSESDSDASSDNDVANDVANNDETFHNAMYEDGEPEGLVDDSSSEEEEEEDEKEGSDIENSADTSAETSSPKKFQVPPECTLFVRNLVFEVKDEDLFEKFSEFGKLRYARVVYDKVTGRSKGTGFVCFSSPADGRQCLELADKLRLWDRQNGSSEGTQATVLVPEAPQELTDRFTLQGRLALVSQAITRQEAEQKADPNRERAREDRRNLYLLREGSISADSPIGKQMDSKELERRQTSFKLRQNELKMNPNKVISLTRLSVRNLPHSIDDKALKALAMRAVSLFKNEVKLNKRSPLSSAEMKQGWDKKPHLVQAKVVRSKDRVVQATGLAKSTGFGFLEFSHHAHSLACLRYLNCNPEVFPPGPNSQKPIQKHKKGKNSAGSTSQFDGRRLLAVEFAIENKAILKRRSERQAQTLRNKQAIVQNQQQEGDPSAKRFKLDKGAADKPEKKKFVFRRKTNKMKNSSGSNSKPNH